MNLLNAFAGDTKAQHPLYLFYTNEHKKEPKYSQIYQSN